jgi:hypothetical protein
MRASSFPGDVRERELHILGVTSKPVDDSDAERFFASIKLTDGPASTGGAAVLTWRTFTNSAKTFEVALPGQPTMSSRTLEDGEKLDVVIVPVGDHGARFLVAEMTATGGANQATADAFINRVAGIPSCSGKFVQLKKAHPTAAERYQIFCMGGVTLLADVHVREKAYYAVVASLPPDSAEVDEGDYAQFRNSFRTLD